jgi:hypothetical protein
VFTFLGKKRKSERIVPAKEGMKPIDMETTGTVRCKESKDEVDRQAESGSIESSRRRPVRDSNWRVTVCSLSLLHFRSFDQCSQDEPNQYDSPRRRRFSLFF